MGDVPPCDCDLSLMGILWCHTPCAVATAKPVLSWERCRGDLPMDLATVDKLLTTTRTVRKRLDLTRSVDPAIASAHMTQDTCGKQVLPSQF